MIRECRTAASNRLCVRSLLRHSQSRIPLFRVLGVFRGSKTDQEPTAEHTARRSRNRTATPIERVMLHGNTSPAPRCRWRLRRRRGMGTRNGSNGGRNEEDLKAEQFAQPAQILWDSSTKEGPEVRMGVSGIPHRTGSGPVSVVPLFSQCLPGEFSRPPASYAMIRGCSVVVFVARQEERLEQVLGFLPFVGWVEETDPSTSLGMRYSSLLQSAGSRRR